MFDELLNLSKKIISSYQELEKLVTEITIYKATNFKVNQEAVMKNPYVYENLLKIYYSNVDKLNASIIKLINAKIKELRELIIKENKLLNSLTDDETDNFINWLERIDTDTRNDESISRLRERLMVREYILSGCSFNENKVLQNSILTNMDFYNKEILPCIIKIKIYKKLKNKIKELSRTKDFWFIRELYRLYEIKKIKEMKNNAFIELIVFMYNFDVELIPSIEDFDIQELKKIYEETSSIIVDWAIDLTDDIASINSDTNDIGVFFELLYNYTYLEVLMDYMDLDELEEFRNAALNPEDNEIEFECSDHNLFEEEDIEDKTAGMKLVRKLIDRRLDEEKN